MLMSPSVKNGFSYQFTPKEFFHFLFGMKCPKCGKKMVRHKHFNRLNGKSLNSKADPFFLSNAEVKRYYYIFRCDACGIVKEIGKNEKKE